MQDAESTTFFLYTAASLDLVASPSEVLADGRNASTITVTVKDARGNAILGSHAISFYTDLGTVRPSTCRTNGTATCSAQAISSQTGAANITASIGTLSKKVQVIFTQYTTKR